MKVMRQNTAFVKSSGTETWSSVVKVNNLREGLFFPHYTRGNSSVGDRKSESLQVFEGIMWPPSRDYRVLQSFFGPREFISFISFSPTAHFSESLISSPFRCIIPAMSELLTPAVTSPRRRAQCASTGFFIRVDGKQLEMFHLTQ